MEEILKTITSNNLYLAAAVILGVIIIISLVKKMIKMIILSLIVISAYLGYLYYTGQKIPKTREETVKHITDKVEKGKVIIEDNVKKYGR